MWSFHVNLLVRGTFGKFLAWSFISVTDYVWYHFNELSFLCVMAQISCRHEKYYCEYMYCLYTGKRKMLVENLTFYLLKSVQNINNSS